MRFARVKNYERYQVHTERSDMICLSLDTFHDSKLAHLNPVEMLGWIAVLIAAKRHKNVIPLPIGDPIRAFVATGAALPGFRLNRYVQLKMVQVLDDAPAKSEPARVERRKRDLKKYDSKENRELIDDANEIFGRNLGYTVTLLQAAERLRSLGYKRADWRKVFQRVAEADTAQDKKNIAAWCKSHFNFEYIVRPGDMGGFDKILNMQNDPAPVEEKKLPRLRSAEEIINDLRRLND